MKWKLFMFIRSQPPIHQKETLLSTGKVDHFDSNYIHETEDYLNMTSRDSDCRKIRPKSRELK